MRLIFILLLLLVSGCSQSDYVMIKGKTVNVELADTNQERTNGLMFREELCEDCGMLFVFEDSDFRSFWMKDTLIPLDVVFIDENLEIVNIEHAAPCLEEVCDIYASTEKVKYVLEVNGNFTIENSINTGDKVAIK